MIIEKRAYTPADYGPGKSKCEKQGENYGKIYGRARKPPQYEKVGKYPGNSNGDSRRKKEKPYIRPYETRLGYKKGE